MSRAWLWILLAAGLISLAVTLLDALLGLDQPQLDEEGRGQFIWQWFEGVPLPEWMTDELVENVRSGTGQPHHSALWPGHRLVADAHQPAPQPGRNVDLRPPVLLSPV